MENFDDEMQKVGIEVIKEVAEDVVRPTSKSIGENIGRFVDGATGWLAYWGDKQKIKQEVYLNDYKNKITDKINAIPQEKLKEPSIGIVGPAIEASKYYIEEESIREIFAQLIASSCNADKAASVHPAYIQMIKQFSPLDAKFFQQFSKYNTFACAEFVEEDKNNKITPFLPVLIDFKDCDVSFTVNEYMNLNKSLDNLSRLGIVEKTSEILELGYNYDSFKEHFLYKKYVDSLESGSRLKMKKERIQLTSLGRELAKCCFEHKTGTVNA